MDHSPAPWKYIKDISFRYIVDSNHYPVCFMRDYDYSVNGETIPKENVDIDGKLIAAAPELIESLKEILSIIAGISGIEQVKKFCWLLKDSQEKSIKKAEILLKRLEEDDGK